MLKTRLLPDEIVANCQHPVAMRIALVNQTFYPDVVASGQHLADLACRLAQLGHKVTVITSGRGYDSPQEIFPKRETWNEIEIHRVVNTGFGKNAKWKRAANFATFLMSCCWRLCLLPRQDVIVALTSPPLVSAIAACFACLRGARFCYWIMDLNPDEAIAAGWLSPSSLGAKCLERFSRFSLSRASAVVVLDRFMQQRVLDKGIKPGKIVVIPPWSHDSEVCFDLDARVRFRKANGFEDKFVIMYSGNHSPCHPLNTLLAAAKELASDKTISFCFVGGGAEFGRVKKFARENGLSNITCLPYQPLEKLSASLSAADLHVVVMGEPFVGLVHPCKLYNILRVGAPLLYLGPTPSHVSDILHKCSNWPYAQAAHGQTGQLVQSILRLKHETVGHDQPRQFPLAAEFSKEALLPRLTAILESTVLPHRAASTLPKTEDLVPERQPRTSQTLGT